MDAGFTVSELNISLSRSVTHWTSQTSLVYVLRTFFFLPQGCVLKQSISSCKFNYLLRLMAQGGCGSSAGYDFTDLGEMVQFKISSLWRIHQTPVTGDVWMSAELMSPTGELSEHRRNKSCSHFIFLYVPSRKPKLTAVGIRCADNARPSIR
jgi:hypothetical protein